MSRSVRLPLRTCDAVTLAVVVATQVLSSQLRQLSNSVIQNPTFLFEQVGFGGKQGTEYRELPRRTTSNAGGDAYRTLFSAPTCEASVTVRCRRCRPNVMLQRVVRPQHLIMPRFTAPQLSDKVVACPRTGHTWSRRLFGTVAQVSKPWPCGRQEDGSKFFCAKISMIFKNW